jgi:hypothetical protein
MFSRLVMLQNTLLGIYGINVLGHIGYTTHSYHKSIKPFYLEFSPNSLPINLLFGITSILPGVLMGGFLGVISPFTYTYAKYTNKPYIMNHVCDWRT